MFNSVELPAAAQLACAVYQQRTVFSLLPEVAV
jgi:hypothetical protein